MRKEAGGKAPPPPPNHPRTQARVTKGTGARGALSALKGRHLHLSKVGRHGLLCSLWKKTERANTDSVVG